MHEIHTYTFKHAAIYICHQHRHYAPFQFHLVRLTSNYFQKWQLLQYLHMQRTVRKSCNNELQIGDWALNWKHSYLKMREQITGR
jgi:hypothetical protein